MLKETQIPIPGEIESSNTDSQTEESYNNFVTENEIGREIGIQKIIRFLEKVIGKESIADPENYLELIAKLDFDQFMKILSTLNGILRQIPRDQRGPSDRERWIGNEKHAAYVAPDPVDAEEIFRETFNQIQEIISGNEPDKLDRVGKALYHAIIYLHPFPNGNGRTSRLCYTLLSSSDQSLHDRVNSVVSGEAQDAARDYHYVLDHSSFHGITHSMGLAPSQMDFNKECKIEGMKIKGFDAERLRFIAAYAFMSDKERETLCHPYNPEDNSVYINAIDVPLELRQKIEKEMPGLRAWFAREMIRQFIDPKGPTPKFIIDRFEKIFKNN